MLTSRISRGVQLANPITYAFSATIALFSGSPQHDVLAKKIAVGLKKSFSEPVEFVGVGGADLKEHFSKVYASSSELHSDPIEIHKTYQERYQDAPVTVYRSLTHFRNRQVLDKVFKGGFLDDLQSKKVCAVINVGNFSFTRRLNTRIREHYANTHKVAPPSLLYDRMCFLRRVENEAFLDFQFYNIPRELNTFSMYRFPSQLIGYESVFEAYRYLSKFSTANDLTADNFSSHQFNDKVRKLATAARKDFRAKNNIPEDSFVILLSPGDTSTDINFTFKTAPGGIKKFLSEKEISSYGKNNFHLLVLTSDNKVTTRITQKNEELIKSKASSLKDSIGVTVVKQEDRYGALAAADYGIVSDGEAAVEAAACQLAASTINSMSFARAYISNILNVYESPLNISTERMGYQELKSSSEANPYKICELLLEHFKNPKLKFYYMETYEQPLKEIVNMRGDNPSNSLKQSGLDASFRTVKAFADRYRAVDVSSYSNHWQARKEAITPQGLTL